MRERISFSEKCVRRLLRGGKFCGMSIADYIEELHVHVRIYVVREKKVGVWNKVNADLDGSRKEFYVGRGTKTNNTLQGHWHLG